MEVSHDDGISILLELGVYNQCERCGRPTRFILCEPCHQVVTALSQRAYERMRRRWLDAGLPWPEE